MDIKWETPPTSKRVSRINPEELAVADQLRKRPNQWARVREFEASANTKRPQPAATLAGLINKGNRAAFRENGRGSFEAVSRTIDGKSVLYVRFTRA